MAIGHNKDWKHSKPQCNRRKTKIPLLYTSNVFVLQTEKFSYKQKMVLYRFFNHPSRNIRTKAKYIRISPPAVSARDRPPTANQTIPSKQSQHAPDAPSQRYTLHKTSRQQVSFKNRNRYAMPHRFFNVKERIGIIILTYRTTLSISPL